MVSSWGFDFGGVRFVDAGSGAAGAGRGDATAAVAWDHGALVPIVAVLMPRQKGDGVNI